MTAKNIFLLLIIATAMMLSAVGCTLEQFGFPKNTTTTSTTSTTTTTTIGENQYKIVLDANHMYNYNETITASFDEEIVLPTCTFMPPSQFMKFCCWCTASNGNGISYSQNDTVVNLTTEPGGTVTLYARWIDKDAYIITYKNLKGADNSKNPMSYKGSEDVTLSEISVAGYTFQGWFDEGGRQYLWWKKDFMAKDLTLWARWTADSYQITYKDQWNETFSTQTDDLPATHTFATATTLVSAAKTGYVFGGWYDNSDCSGDIITEIGPSDYTDNITLYAKWTPIQYTVFFNANLPNGSQGGGTGEQFSQTLTYDVAAALSECAFATPTDCRFDCWNTAADGSGTKYSQSEIVKNLTAEQNGTVTLYAWWIDKDSFHLIYNNLKGADNSANSGIYKQTTSFELHDIGGVRGYTFVGWYDASADGNRVTGWNVGDRTGDVTLWAEWTANQYAITYKDCGNEAFSGDETGLPTTHTYGTDTVLTEPVKTDYTFEGWYLQPDCSGDGIDTIGATQTAENVTLYAKWLYGIKCSAAELSTVLAGLSADGGPYTVTITDVNPNMSVIKSALSANKSKKINLDLTRCTELTAVGNRAFYNCSGLTGITLPDSVTSIDNSAFKNCSAVKYAQAESTAANVLSKAGYSFRPVGQRYDLRYLYTDDRITGCEISNVDKDTTELTIPDGVTSIGYSAFSGCSSLTGVEIPNGVTSIGSSAFSGCSSLTGVTIPDDVTSIGSSAFSGCSILMSVTIPDSVAIIGESVFNGCFCLSSIIVDANNTVYDSRNDCNAIIETSSNTLIVGCKNTIIPNDVTSIGDNAFSGCTGLTSVTIPDSVTSIGSSAFYGCSGLTSVTRGYCVTSIGDSAFSGCSSLTSVTIHTGVTGIGDNTFFGCRGLTSVEIPNSVTSIGSSAFSYCTGLRSVTIPDGVTSIGSSAFSDCRSLTGVTIPDGVTVISDSVFSGCSSLTGVAIPDGVTSIGDQSFFGCSGLTSVAIPDGVTSIGSSAFSGCSNLASVTIGTGITGIKVYAFSGCTALQVLTVKATEPPTFGSGMLSGCSALEKIYVPSGYDYMYWKANGWRDYLDYIYEIN